MELIKQGGRRGNKVKAFGCARLLNSRGMQRMLNRTVTHRARNKSGSNPLRLHTAVVYLMLRAVYNAVMARERGIQTEKGESRRAKEERDARLLPTSSSQ